MVGSSEPAVMVSPTVGRSDVAEVTSPREAGKTVWAAETKASGAANPQERMSRQRQTLGEEVVTSR